MHDKTEHYQIDTSNTYLHESSLDPSICHPTYYRSKAHSEMVHGFTENFLAKKDYNNQQAYSVSATYLEPKAIPLTADSANRFLDKLHKCVLGHLAGSRSYQRPWFRKIEPEFHAFLDVPGSKPKHSKHPSLPKHESTFHHHGIMLCHQDHVPLMDELCQEAKADLFSKQIRGICQLKTLNVQRIKPTPEDMKQVVKYATWHASRFFGSGRWDEFYLILGNGLSDLHEIRRAPLARPAALMCPVFTPCRASSGVRSISTCSA